MGSIAVLIFDMRERKSFDKRGSRENGAASALSVGHVHIFLREQEGVKKDPNTRAKTQSGAKREQNSGKQCVKITNSQPVLVTRQK